MKKFTSGLLIAPFVWAAFCASASAESFLQVYLQAKKYDAQLKSQESAYLATLESKPQILSQKKPQLSLTGNANIGRQFDISDSTTNTNSGASYTLGVTKSLYNKQLDAQIDQVDASILQAKSQLEQQRLDLVLRVAEPYFNFLRAQETLASATAEKNAVARQLKQVRAFFNAGTSAITDVREVEASFNSTVALEISARQSVDDARELLRVVTGRSYQRLNGASPDLPLVVPLPRNVQAWVDLAKKNSKTLKTARDAIEVARRQIQVQRSSRQPVVNAFARHTGSANGNNTNPFDPINTGFTVGVEMNLSLYEGGAYSSRIREAQHQFRQAQQSYQFQERQIEQQIRSAYFTIETSIGEVRAQEKALASARTAAEFNEKSFAVGIRTAVDVLTALSNVFAARTAYANALYNYLLAVLQLRQAAGTLSEQDIRTFSQLLTTPVPRG